MRIQLHFHEKPLTLLEIVYMTPTRDSCVTEYHITKSHSKCNFNV